MHVHASMVFGCSPLSFRCFRCVWYCRSNGVADVEIMLACPHERLQNHSINDEGVIVQGSSCGHSLRLLRVAASSNPSLELSANGRSPNPSCCYAVHFTRPGMASYRRRPLRSDVSLLAHSYGHDKSTLQYLWGR